MVTRSLSIEWWRREKPAPASANQVVEGRFAFLAFVMFTVVLVAAPHQYFPLPPEIRIAFLFAVLAAGTHLFEVLRGKRPIVPPEVKLALGLLGWVVATIPLSLWPGGSVQLLTDQFIKSIIVFWVLTGVITTVGRLRIFIWTLACTCVPVAWNGVSAYLAGNMVDGRIVMGAAAGITGNANDLAVLLCLFLPLVVSAALCAREAAARIFAWGVVVLCVVAIMLTFSRQGLFILAAEALVLSALLWRRRQIKGLGAVLATALLIAIFLPAGLSNRLSSAFGEEVDGSAMVRQQDQWHALEYIARHPIVGAGLGQNGGAIDPLRDRRSWTALHNVYLGIGVDLGLVGLGVFLTILVMSYRSASRIENLRELQGRPLTVYASAIRISLAGFIVAGFFSTIAYHFHFYYLAGLAVSLRAAASSALAPRS